MNQSQILHPLDATDVRQIFFTNLLLLGFEPRIHESQTRIQFHCDMFAVPNRAGFEIIIKFLFDRLDQIRSKQEFSDCWPICDKKREMAFRKVCIAWLTQISERSDSNLPSIAHSLLLCPGGHRCYQLLANFSRYVLKQVMRKELGDKGGTLTPKFHNTQFNLRDVQAGTLMSATVAERKKYFECLKSTIIETEEQAKFARWLESRFVKMPTELTLSDEKAQQCDKLLKKIRKQWSVLEDTLDEGKQERDVIQSVVQGGMERYKISASDMSLRVPNRLLERFEKEMHLRGRSNTYCEGKVNILSVLGLFNMALSGVVNKLREDDLPNFNEIVPTVTSDVSLHQKQLANIIALQSNLSDVILPSIKHSAAVMEKKIQAEM